MFLSIGEYLIERLAAHGVRHVFGNPGDYVERGSVLESRFLLASQA
jgi:hypothetical protein